jgi:hypothetical protein
MQNIKEIIGSTHFMERLLKAESAILIGNLLCGFFVGLHLVGFPIIFIMFGLAIYRLLILSGLKDGSTVATWWYCVMSYFFALRFMVIVATYFGAQFGGFAIPKDMVSVIALLFLTGALVVRAVGCMRTLLIDLNSRARLTASIAMGVGTIGFYAGAGWILMFSALESVFYGYQIRLH